MKDVFPLVSSGASVLWIVVPATVLLAAVLVLFLMLGFSSRRGSVETSSEGLELVVPFYGRTIPISALDLDAARAVDLKLEPNLALRWRTNGIGLPRYEVGWFRLNDGQKALAAVTDPTKVLYVPTRDGFALLVSVAEPERVIESLRRHAAAGRSPRP